MSWDVFVENAPPEAKRKSDLPEGFHPPRIGKRSEIVAAIRQVIPSADFAHPNWGMIEGKDWSIEVYFEPEEECHRFALHVRGREIAIGAVVAILQRLGLRALDAQTGEFFVPPEGALEPFLQWQNDRDRTAGAGSA